MTTLRIERHVGHIAVSAIGEGPLVLCVPGMGESAASFRHLLSGLAAAGFRAAVMDLRGHGESSAESDSYDDLAAASDALCVIEALGGSAAAVVGNSMGAAAAVLAATQRPPAVERLVLIGPFVRDHGTAASRLSMRLLLARPWGPAVWRSYYRSLFGKQRPADHDEHVAAALALLRRPGRWRAFQATARTSHAPAEAVLTQVAAPTLVVMGDSDRDFGDPEAEARWVAAATRGRHMMVAGAGHYPMSEQTDIVLRAIVSFLTEEASRG